MGENACHAVGNLDCKAGLADTAGSCQCHQPDSPARQQIDQARGFLLASKKARQNGWQFNVQRYATRIMRLGADLFGKRHGFNGRSETKFGCQHTAAGVVNIQCSAAAIRARQHAHQLTVSSFTQVVHIRANVAW
jgi:hypothetical protein